MRCRGKLILIADADGATQFKDYLKLAEKLERDDLNRGVVYGSRRHLQDEAVARVNNIHHE